MEEKGGFKGRKLPVRVEYVSCPIDLPVHEGNYRKMQQGTRYICSKTSQLNISQRGDAGKPFIPAACGPLPGGGDKGPEEYFKEGNW